MPGPAPKRNVLRRNAGRSDWRKLPRAGRTGPPPAWPMPTRITKAQEHLWNQLWHTPQAVAWEEMGWTRQIARYVVSCVKAEAPGGTAAMLSETRQMEDRLGLTPMAMRKLFWEMEPEAEENSTAAGVTHIGTYRDMQ